MAVSSRVSSRLARTIGVLVGLSLVLPIAATQAPVVAAGGSCTGWQSTLVPPDTIRVFRKATGLVEVVPFRDYVRTVAAKEWPGYLPVALIEAGTVAVKQYGWFYAMEGRHRRSYVSESGECYDVRDTTGDQLYKPEKARVTNKHHAAVAATWDFSLRKNHRQFLTGYRTGNKGPCASDATGWKLFGRTATRCAEELGYDWLQILHAYYGPELLIVHRDGSLIGIDGQVIGDSSVIGSALPVGAPATTFDERHDAIEWHGDWQRTRADAAHRRTLTHTSDRDASAVFRIAGKSLDLVGRKGPNRGRLQVYVNGILVETVDLYAAERKHQQVVFSITWQEDNVRTIRLAPDGPADRPRVDIDAIVLSR